MGRGFGNDDNEGGRFDSRTRVLGICGWFARLGKSAVTYERGGNRCLDCTKASDRMRLAGGVETMRRTGLCMHEKFVLYWMNLVRSFLLDSCYVTDGF